MDTAESFSRRSFPTLRIVLAGPGRHDADGQDCSRSTTGERSGRAVSQPVRGVARNSSLIFLRAISTRTACSMLVARVSPSPWLEHRCGMHSVMGAAIEPEIETVTPVVAGAGILDIMLRSGLHFILEPLSRRFSATLSLDVSLMESPQPGEYLETMPRPRGRRFRGTGSAPARNTSRTG